MVIIDFIINYKGYREERENEKDLVYLVSLSWEFGRFGIFIDCVIYIVICIYF